MDGQPLTSRLLKNGMIRRFVALSMIEDDRDRTGNRLALLV
jgi:hypothetical protein